MFKKKIKVIYMIKKHRSKEIKEINIIKMKRIHFLRKSYCINGFKILDSVSKNKEHKRDDYP